jgi:hypothetical protein
MCRSDVTRGMLSLNLINTGCRREQTRLSELALSAQKTTEGQTSRRLETSG